MRYAPLNGPRARTAGGIARALEERRTTRERAILLDAAMAAPPSAAGLPREKTPASRRVAIHTRSRLLTRPSPTRVEDSPAPAPTEPRAARVARPSRSAGRCALGEAIMQPARTPIALVPGRGLAGERPSSLFSTARQRARGARRPHGPGAGDGTSMTTSGIADPSARRRGHNAAHRRGTVRRRVSVIGSSARRGSRPRRRRTAATRGARKWSWVDRVVDSPRPRAGEIIARHGNPSGGDEHPAPSHRERAPPARCTARRGQRVGGRPRQKGQRVVVVPSSCRACRARLGERSHRLVLSAAATRRDPPPTPRHRIGTA